MSKEEAPSKSSGLWDLLGRANKGFWIWADKNPAVAAILIGLLSFFGASIWLLDRNKDWGVAIGSYLLSSPIWTNWPSGYIWMLSIYMLWQIRKLSRRSADCEARETLMQYEIGQLKDDFQDLFMAASIKTKQTAMMLKEERAKLEEQQSQDRRKMQRSVLVTVGEKVMSEHKTDWREARTYIALITVVGGGYLLKDGDQELRLAVIGLMTIVLTWYFGSSQSNKESGQRLDTALANQNATAVALADKVAPAIPGVQEVKVVNPANEPVPVDAKL